MKVHSNSSAQGTIEYLVIIAVVVVISLIVVALLLGVFENNSDVGSTAQQISTQTLPIALNEAILGTGTDANGLIVLTNNTSHIIRDVRVIIDGKDHNYFGINVSQGNKVTFQLNFLQEPCPIGQDKVIKNITIKYTTKDGLEKTQKIENIQLQCIPKPTSTTTPIQEKQQASGEQETPQEEPDNIVPELNYLSSVVDGNNIRLTFRAWDNNKIKQFDKNRTEQTTFTQFTPTQKTGYLDGNYYYVDFNNLNYSTTYTMCIKITDHNNNTTTKCDTNTTGTEPSIGLCPGQTELYGECYSNVVVYYPLDESSDPVIDYSGLNNNGTNNGATTNQTGKQNKAYLFNGTSNYISAPGNSSINLVTNLTMMAWVYFTGSGTNNHMIIARLTPGAIQYGLFRFSGTNKFSVHMNGGGTDHESSTILNDNTWYHLAATYDSSANQIKLYVNGSLVHTSTKNIDPTSSSEGNLEIGRESTWGPEYMKGIVDEVIIFNSTLTETQINEIYTNSK